MSSEIHVGDTGLSFNATVLNQSGTAIDLTDASIVSIDMVFKKPNATVVTKDATFIGDGTDGRVKYVTESTADLDIPGKWSMQVFANLTGGGEWHSDISKFDVKANLK